MRRMHATAAGILLGLGLAVGGAATAQTVIPGGENGDWKAYTFKKGGVTVCYMASAPKKSEGDYSKRDAAYALVTNDPTTSSHGEVSFVAGYPFKKDSTVGVTIGGKTFELFTKTDKAPDGAWTQGPEDDRSLVAAMVGGEDMVVKGVSSRGTETVDTYSLLGFTATRKVIDKICPK
ncbi:MAG TPA: invasion associated locus B family protein [Thalassobaculum sp.]